MSRELSTLLLFAACLYSVHALLTVTRLFRSRTPALAQQWGAVAAALLAHTVFVAIRAAQVDRLPIATRLDSVSLFLWVAAATFIACRRPYRLAGLEPLFWPLFAAGMVGAWLVAGREPTGGSSLTRFWLALHLVPVYIGYAGFAVAAGAGLGYVVQEGLLRRKAGGALWRKFPSLETLERIGRSALSLGFPVLTVGLVAGVVWAEQGSAPLGRGWYTDPKVVGGFVVWLFYAAVLHVRLFARVRGRRAALLTIVGFLLTVASFLAAHAYEAPTRESTDAAAEERAARS